MPTLEQTRQALMKAAVDHLYHPKQTLPDQERQMRLYVLVQLFSRCPTVKWELVQPNQLRLVGKEAHAKA